MSSRDRVRLRHVLPLAVVLLVLLVLLVGCAPDPRAVQPHLAEPSDTGWALPEPAAQAWGGAHITAVELDGQGVLVVGNSGEVEADLGLWAVTGDDGLRIPLPPSTRIPAGELLRVHLGRGPERPGELSLGLGDVALDRDAGRLLLVDSSGKTVARFVYGQG